MTTKTNTGAVITMASIALVTWHLFTASGLEFTCRCVRVEDAIADCECLYGVRIVRVERGSV